MVVMVVHWLTNKCCRFRDACSDAAILLAICSSNIILKLHRVDSKRYVKALHDFFVSVCLRPRFLLHRKLIPIFANLRQKQMVLILLSSRHLDTSSTTCKGRMRSGTNHDMSSSFGCLQVSRQKTLKLWNIEYRFNLLSIRTHHSS